MNEHISKETILKYAAGILSSQEQQDVDKHLDACNNCLAQIAYGYAKSHESCARAQDLFTAFLDNVLGQQETDFVQQHLLVCDNCLAKYDVLAERCIAADSSISDGCTLHDDISGIASAYDNTKREEDRQIEKLLKEQSRQISADPKAEEQQKSKSKNASSPSITKKRT